MVRLDSQMRSSQCLYLKQDTVLYTLKSTIVQGEERIELTIIVIIAIVITIIAVVIKKCLL